jgi:hypothetical protein
MTKLDIGGAAIPCALCGSLEMQVFHNCPHGNPCIAEMGTAERIRRELGGEPRPRCPICAEDATVTRLSDDMSAWVRRHNR